MKRLLIITCALLSFASCTYMKKKDLKTLDDPTIQQYFLTYGDEDLSKESQMKVRFAQKVITPEEIGTQLDPAHWSLDPKTKAQAQWIDLSTLAIVPEGHWENGKEYRLQLEMDDILKGDQEVGTVYLSYGIKPMKLEMITGQAYQNSLGAMEITGSVKSTDVLNTSDIASIVEVSQKGNSRLGIEWNESEKSRYHSFKITGIDRKEDLSQVKLIWDGRSIDPDFKGRRTIQVLPKEEFKVLSIESGTGASRRITAQFSDLLHQSQELAGLVTITGYDGDIDLSRDGHMVYIDLEKTISGSFEIVLSDKIKRQDGKSMAQEGRYTLSFDPIKPAVRLVGKGVIVPGNERVIFPFESINLKGIQLEIFKIYENNVLQFLQNGSLDGTYGLKPVGRVVYQKEIDLSDQVQEDVLQWTRHTLDLADFVALDPGALYQVRIGFAPYQVINYKCRNPETIDQKSFELESAKDGFKSIMSRRTRYGREWEYRNDPCYNNYYTAGKYVKRNVLASNFGAILKREEDNRVLIAVSDLLTARPMRDVTVRYYDFQQQEIASGQTDGSGFLTVDLTRRPAFAVLEKEGALGYLNIQDAQSNSLSEFDVSGAMIDQEINGLIYGERGVWRPGDTLFLNVVLEDKSGNLPDDHPVTFSVKDSRGNVQFQNQSKYHVGGIYPFIVPTRQKAPTGNWTAVAKVGNMTFRKTLKVETVKPNRLKIDFAREEDLAIYKDEVMTLHSEWLHGASAAGLRAKVDLRYSPYHEPIDGYDSYTFQDPAREERYISSTVFDGALDDQGNAQFSVKRNENWLPPGRLKAAFTTKVFEKGGNFSSDYYSLIADPYAAYVGLKVPKRKWGRAYVPRGQKTPIPIVSVSPDGEPLAGKKLSVGVYRAEWHWWYERGRNNLYRYNTAQHNDALYKGQVTTSGDGTASFNLLLNDWGAYMIRVCDEESGHCTGQLFYTGYGRSSGQSEGPRLLTLESDKESYTQGEMIHVDIPSTEESRVFVSIESGTEILQYFWLDGQKNSTRLEIPVTAEMHPNAYLHVHSIQKHNDGTNELPMRLYGVLPIKVKNAKKIIKPELDVAETIEPNTDYVIKVGEESGQPMAYTLAVVDEGLLALTRFATPDLYNHFYSKRALRVKTWDVYDDVLDGYGGSLDRFISIGGDARLINPGESKKANRFQSVVEHLGPFYLEKGETADHRLTMPNYVGEVRVMLVAREGDAYGKAEKSVKVKKPLMNLATAPRVLSPGDEIDVPVNVFALEDEIKSVSTKISHNELFSLIGEDEKSLTFARKGDKQSYFKLRAEESTGVADFEVISTGHGEKSSDRVELDVRNPMPVSSEVYSAQLQPGEKWEPSIEYFGVAGTNEAFLEASQLPAINLEKRMKYLVGYPYGCLEQTTSKALAQLVLHNLVEPSPSQRNDINNNVRAAISKIQRHQIGSGGLAYWRGASRADDWATSYAGYFILRAKQDGYQVDPTFYDAWLDYQKRSARLFRMEGTEAYASSRQALTQAFRLYTLALAGSPDVGGMNRLRLVKQMDNTSRYVLAAAYASIGQSEAAENLIADYEATPKSYEASYRTYGSALRDQSLMTIAMLEMDNGDSAASLAREIAENLGKGNWYSTHSLSFALTALADYVDEYGSEPMAFSFSRNSETQNYKPEKALWQKELREADRGVTIENTSESVLFVRLIVSGQKAPDENMKAKESSVKMKVSYTDRDGKSINPNEIRQGTDFYAIVELSNTGARRYNATNLALRQVFPAGWEIQNERMTGNQDNSNSGYSYRDIRDDRVYTFFDLQSGSPKRFTVALTATYAGDYFMPPTTVEAMYDHEIYTQSASGRARVLTSEVQ